MTGRACLFAVLGLALAVGSARAGRVDVEATEVAIIENPADRSETRAAVLFVLPSAVLGKQIEAAYFDWLLSVSRGEDPDLKEVSLEAFELGTAWDGEGVGWSEPWRTPGGDVREGAKAVWLTAPGSDELVRFEITDSVEAWVKGERSNFGVLVVVGGAEVGFAPGASSVAGGDSRAPVLRIWYSK